MYFGIEPDTFMNQIRKNGHPISVPIRTHERFSYLTGTQVNNHTWGISYAARDFNPLFLVDTNTGVITIKEKLAEGGIIGQPREIEACNSMLRKCIHTDSTKYPFSPVLIDHVPAFDGMQITADGTILNPRKALRLRKSRKKTHRMRYRSVRDTLMSALALSERTDRYSPQLTRTAIENAMAEDYIKDAPEKYACNDRYPDTRSVPEKKVLKQFTYHNYADNLAYLVDVFNSRNAESAIDAFAGYLSEYYYIGEEVCV